MKIDLGYLKPWLFIIVVSFFTVTCLITSVNLSPDNQLVNKYLKETNNVELNSKCDNKKMTRVTEYNKCLEYKFTNWIEFNKKSLKEGGL